MPGSFGEYDSKRSLADDSPCYISPRSADVILSDVRPTKLAIDALDAINAFLDELLHTVLRAARALTTTQLRAGLHKVLPTTLGKEAVLEAELELRAYWERTGGIPELGSSLVVIEDNAFSLEWTFELLRLKCEAYSTLSDTDENSEAETRLFQRMSVEGISPPKQAFLAPASLYLTAIIESICEHIVSNVGRVAARDSSRAIANGQDLFIALCEDSSIYGLFKNMTVYGQIEALSKMPRSRQSMSVAHETDGASFRRNGSRLSSESVNNTPTSARPSVDRARSVKVLYNKVSQDFINGSDPGHRKMDSFASANTKQSLASKGDRSPISPTFSEDTRSQEFDDMMRSGSTMKVSLTPDRLRTMEALNKEKARANGQQKVPPKTEKSNSITSHPSLEHAKRTSGSTPTVRRAGSIIGTEDDRLMHKPPPTSRPRQLSAATASSHIVPSFTRLRASSTTTNSSTALPTGFLNKHTPSESASVSSDQRSVTKGKLIVHELDRDASRPSRARAAAHSRESLDLGDVLAGSDDDGMGDLKSPKQRDRQRGLSANTKELIAFLAEGPPELTSAENSLSPFSTTPKKSGRLQKMISRITLASDTARAPRKMTVGSGDSSSKSMTNLSPLANRPVPPRYPIPVPSSVPSSECDSADQAVTQPRPRAHSYVQKPSTVRDVKPIEKETVVSPVPSLIHGIEEGSIETNNLPENSQKCLEIDISKHIQLVKSRPPRTSPPPATSATAPIRVETADPTLIPAVQLAPLPPTASQRMPSKTTSSTRHKILPSSTSSTPPPALPVLEHAQEMRAMLEHATSAAECRILVDMFLARSKLVIDVAESRALATPRPRRDSSVNELEGAIVEMLLGEREPDPWRKSSPESRNADAGEPLFKAADGPSTSSAYTPAEPSDSC